MCFKVYITLYIVNVYVWGSCVMLAFDLIFSLFTDVWISEFLLESSLNGQNELRTNDFWVSYKKNVYHALYSPVII